MGNTRAWIRAPLVLGLQLLLLLLLPGGLLMNGCGHNPDPDAVREELLEADRAFAAMAREQGPAVAFGHWAAEDAILFREGGGPITGRESIRARFEGGSGLLLWEPYQARAGSGGDLGYTLGRWSWYTDTELGAAPDETGFYVTIWQRQPDGDWRFSFDSGVTAPADVPPVPPALND
jgi:ketosteroid isomerase-like protein